MEPKSIPIQDADAAPSSAISEGTTSTVVPQPDLAAEATASESVVEESTTAPTVPEGVDISAQPAPPEVPESSEGETTGSSESVTDEPTEEPRIDRPPVDEALGEEPQANEPPAKDNSPRDDLTPPPEMTSEPVKQGEEGLKAGVQPKKKSGRGLVVAVAVSLAVVLAAAAVLMFLKTKNDTTPKDSANNSTSNKVPVSATDIDATTKDVENTLSTLDDGKDFAADALSDKSLGLQ